VWEGFEVQMHAVCAATAELIEREHRKKLAELRHDA
jgi:hypothetical protein